MRSLGLGEDWIRLAKVDLGLSGLGEAGARRGLANRLSGLGGDLSRQARWCSCLGSRAWFTGLRVKVPSLNLGLSAGSLRAKVGRPKPSRWLEAFGPKAGGVALPIAKRCLRVSSSGSESLSARGFENPRRGRRKLQRGKKAQKSIDLRSGATWSGVNGLAGGSRLRSG